MSLALGIVIVVVAILVAGLAVAIRRWSRSLEREMNVDGPTCPACGRPSRMEFVNAAALWVEVCEGCGRTVANCTRCKPR